MYKRFFNSNASISFHFHLNRNIVSMFTFASSISAQISNLLRIDTKEDLIEFWEIKQTRKKNMKRTEIKKKRKAFHFISLFQFLSINELFLLLISMDKKDKSQKEIILLSIPFSSPLFLSIFIVFSVVRYVWLIQQKNYDNYLLRLCFLNHCLYVHT